MYSKFAQTANIERFMQKFKCSMGQAILCLDLSKNNFETAVQIFIKSNLKVQPEQVIHKFVSNNLHQNQKQTEFDLQKHSTPVLNENEQLNYFTIPNTFNYKTNDNTSAPINNQTVKFSQRSNVTFKLRTREKTITIQCEKRDRLSHIFNKMGLDMNKIFLHAKKIKDQNAENVDNKVLYI
ncbi:Hypothetical_protein [Hexamita inflata]|uniref:Hypothetical_protein n=1 Tax=Hexamita inflata TaxID=28002 RepID=A0AA86P4Z3_9EUKA|nr:Hypothetical protein HINF_LOCUS18159 [Hexamita inflata]